VTSGGGTVTKEYTLTINRSSNSNLKTLAVKNGKAALAMTPSFSKYVVGYDLSVSIAAVAIQAIAEDPAATIKVNDILIQSGGISQTITLSAGLNNIVVTVTPVTGNQIKTYTIRIQKQ
jgi:hypothetical protein